jgi:hypothetical protein
MPQSEFEKLCQDLKALEELAPYLEHERRQRIERLITELRRQVEQALSRESDEPAAQK